MEAGTYCKGSMSLGNGCGKCSRCLDEMKTMSETALDKDATAWQYRIVGLRGNTMHKYNLENNRERIVDMLRHGGFWVEPLFPKLKTFTSPVNEQYQDALVQIAFDPDVSDLAANPSKWASIIAFLALGGRIANGRKIDTKDEVLNRIKNPE
jgi:hypothetical protein